MPDIKEELRLKQEKGERIKAVLNSETWKNDILPVFNNLKQEFLTGIVWRQDTKTVDEIGIGCVFNSGAIGTIELILTKLNTIVKIGEEAKDKLLRMDERK